MARLIDPTLRARTFIARKGADLGGQKSRRRIGRLERRVTRPADSLDVPDGWTVVETVDELPEADERHVGRLVHVRTADGVDTLNIGLGQDDDETTWFALNLDLPSDALAFAPLRTLGSSGTGAGQFSTPTGVAVDASGNVFVADTSNHRVQRYNAATAAWTTLGGLASGSGNGQFAYPQGVAVDPSGTGQAVVVADTNNHRVQVLTNALAYSSQFGSSGAGNGQFANPRGVAVDGAGNRWVADTENNRVQKFTSAGAYSSQFGSYGTGDGQFSNPYGVAVGPDGSVWVADTGNDRVQRFSSGGVYQSQFGSYGSGVGQLGAPSGIACDSAGNVYVAEMGNHRVQVFDPAGNVLALFGGYGTGVGQMRYPWGVAVDFAGNVYVAEPSNDRVSVWGQPDQSSLSSYEEFDDFNGGNTASGSIGELGWATSGAGSVAVQASTAYHAGIVRINSGGASGNKHQLTYGPFLLDQISQTQQLACPVVATSAIYRMGLLDNPGNPSNGVYAEFDTSTDSTWKAVKNSGGTTTRTDLGIALSAGSWYRATLAWAGPGSMSVTLRRMDTGQEAVATHTSIPAATQLYLGFNVQTRTGSARQFDVDAARLRTQNIWRV